MPMIQEDKSLHPHAPDAAHVEPPHASFAQGRNQTLAPDARRGAELEEVLTARFSVEQKPPGPRLMLHPIPGRSPGRIRSTSRTRAGCWSNARAVRPVHPLVGKPTYGSGWSTNPKMS